MIALVISRGLYCYPGLFAELNLCSTTPDLCYDGEFGSASCIDIPHSGLMSSDREDEYRCFCPPGTTGHGRGPGGCASKSIRLWNYWVFSFVATLNDGGQPLEHLLYGGKPCTIRNTTHWWRSDTIYIKQDGIILLPHVPISLNWKTAIHPMVEM